MAPLYPCGEEIRAGDRIRFHGEAGEVEFAAVIGDPENGWYVEHFGPGCMVATPGFGAVYVSEGDPHLEFAGRASA